MQFLVSLVLKTKITIFSCNTHQMQNHYDRGQVAPPVQQLYLQLPSICSKRIPNTHNLNVVKA